MASFSYIKRKSFLVISLVYVFICINIMVYFKEIFFQLKIDICLVGRKSIRRKKHNNSNSNNNNDNNNNDNNDNEYDDNNAHYKDIIIIISFFDLPCDTSDTAVFLWFLTLNDQALVKYVPVL